MKYGPIEWKATKAFMKNIASTVNKVKESQGNQFRIWFFRGCKSFYSIIIALLINRITQWRKKTTDKLQDLINYNTIDLASWASLIERRSIWSS
ncbi:unnamed protein product [Cunninghamella blakesleeana]